MRMTRRSLLLSIAAPTAFSKPWEDGKYPSWSAEDIDQLITDSPWARPWNSTVSVPLESKMISSYSQIGGIGLPSRIPGVSWPGGSRPGAPSGRGPVSNGGPLSLRLGVSATVRWASALPVRRAMVLQEFGRDGLEHPRALETLSRQDTDYVIELAGLPRNIAGGETEGIRKQLLKSARLSPAGKRSAGPASVEVPGYGNLVTATLRFPRISDLNTEIGTIEFSAALGAARIAERFKLRSMVYEGRLEL
jgi:hypothetical protein